MAQLYTTNSTHHSNMIISHMDYNYTIDGAAFMYAYESICTWFTDMIVRVTTHGPEKITTEN